MFHLFFSIVTLNECAANDSTLYSTHFAAQAFMHVYNTIPPLSELMGKQLRIAIPVTYPPFVNYANFSDAAELECGYGPGVVMEILKDLKEVLNLTYEIVPFSNEMLGNKSGWPAAFEYLATNNVDIIAGGAVMRYDLSQIYDLTYPFLYDTTAMLIKKNDKKHYEKFMIITEPFRWEVWILTIACIILSGLFFIFISRGIGQSYNEIVYTPFDCFWLFISIVLQQGLRDQPKSNSCRIMIGFWWLASLTLMATFTGSLVAIFATESKSLPFHDLHSLLRVVKQGKYIIVLDSNSVINLENIKNSNKEDVKDLWNEININKKVLYVNGTYEAIQLVISKPGYVFLGSRETILYYASLDCSLLAVTDDLLPAYLSIPMSLNSNYSMIFSNRIRELVERGFIAKWLNDYSSYASIKGAHNCNYSSTSPQAYLDLNRTQGAFWILLGGLMMSLLLFTFEHIFTYYQIKYNRNKVY